jgi:hypothetical protein
MFKSLQPTEDSFVIHRRAWVCLLLSVLFLYNPFLAMQGSSGVLSVGHPPSYRATVASSELLKFENSKNSTAIAIEDVDLSATFILIQAQPRPPAGHGDTEILHATDQFLSGKLWFRPPPAV